MTEEQQVREKIKKILKLARESNPEDEPDILVPFEVFWSEQILKLFPEYEPVELEALGDNLIVRGCTFQLRNETRITIDPQPDSGTPYLEDFISQATIQKNQKGQLYRIRSEKE